MLGGERDGDIIKVIRSVVTAEEPISAQFLVKRVLSLFGIPRYGSKLENKVLSLFWRALSRA